MQDGASLVVEQGTFIAHIPHKLHTEITIGLLQFIDVAVGVPALGLAPSSSLVRAGMMSSVIGLLKCSEFAPLDDVGFIQNPFGWAAGRKSLQYHRGSVAVALIVVCVLWVCGAGVLIAVKMMYRDTMVAWSTAINTLRLPSIAVVPILLISEVCVSSAVSLLFYHGSDASDIVMALVVLGPLFAYIGVYVHNTAISGKYMNVKPAIGNCRGGRRQKSLWQYAMEPTHDIHLINAPSSNNEDDDIGTKKRGGSGEGWLRRNFYFVADRQCSLSVWLH